MTQRKSRVAARFDNAVPHYDRHSNIQRQAAAGLSGRILVARLPRTLLALEVGCGTGHLSRLLVPELPHAQWLITDLAPNMVTACRERFSIRSNITFAVMDGEKLAVPGQHFDLICTNLAAQWFDDLRAGINELLQSLKPGGMIALATLGSETFREWRDSHTKIGRVSPTPDYPTATELAACFPSKGKLTLEEETMLEPHADALSFARALRAVGADTARSGHTPLPATEFRKLISEANRLRPFPARYHLLYALYRKANR